MEDKLKEMFDIQQTSQKFLGTWDKIQDNPSMRQQFINQMILACHEEVTEIMRETMYKNPEMVPFGWKKTQVENSENLKEEIVDLWHFVMNLALVSGMDSDEFYKIYKKKNEKNLVRWNNGY